MQVIHKNFKISRIRNFYMRKVKFTQDSFDEKLGAILEEFPIIDVSPTFLGEDERIAKSVAKEGPTSVFLVPCACNCSSAKGHSPFPCWLVCSEGFP